MMTPSWAAIPLASQVYSPNVSSPVHSSNAGSEAMPARRRQPSTAEEATKPTEDPNRIRASFADRRNARSGPTRSATITGTTYSTSAVRTSATGSVRNRRPPTWSDRAPTDQASKSGSHQWPAAHPAPAAGSILSVVDSAGRRPTLLPNRSATKIVAANTPRFIDLGREHSADVRAELFSSLTATRPFIAPKFLYDRLGSALFTAICELPEYYPTRTEAAIFDAHLDEIADSLGAGTALIDLGAGDCAKAARLFERFSPAQYVAVDISVEFVRHALDCLQRQFPALPMLGLGADFSRGLRLPAQVRAERRVFFYPGSSIGNFTPGEARAFLSGLRSQVDPDGGLLLGVDLAKSAQVLVPAYDDALGVTAAFNLNLLNHVNRLIGTDFRVADWKHVALYDETQQRIEMHVEARRELSVRWTGGELRFRAGDRIHTENSYKYRDADVEAMLADAGFAARRCWQDDQGWFAVFHATPVAAGGEGAR